MCSGCACSNACYVSCICSVTILTFYWLNYWIIKINYKIVINSVFIWRFWFSNWMNYLSVVSSSLSSSVESSNSFVWWSELLIILFVNGSMLYSLIVEWLISILLNSLDWWPYEVIHNFSSILYLLWVKWSCHIKVLFLLSNYIRVGWMICTTSFLTYDLCLVQFVTGFSWNVSS